MDIPIGELSRRTGVKVPTIRYYEDVGLLPPPARTEGRQRRYAADDVSRLDFVRHARELGFEVDAIRELLYLSAERDRSCAEIDAIARRHIAAVARRIDALLALKGELRRMVEACGHGIVGDCRVIETLGITADARTTMAGCRNGVGLALPLSGLWFIGLRSMKPRSERRRARSFKSRADQ